MVSIENLRFAKGLDPVADAFALTVYSDVVRVSEAHKAFFVIQKGVGTVGRSVVTVQASLTNSPDTLSAVPFRYRRFNDSDTPGAVTEAAATGFTTTAGSSDGYVIEVDMKALASSGYKFVVLKMVESADGAVVGSILVILVPRYADHSAAITS